VNTIKLQQSSQSLAGKTWSGNFLESLYPFGKKKKKKKSDVKFFRKISKALQKLKQICSYEAWEAKTKYKGYFWHPVANFSQLSFPILKTCYLFQRDSIFELKALR